MPLLGLTENRVAVGTADAATERTLTYTQNAMLATLTDAEDNKTSWEYDGFDRAKKTRYPLPTQGANASSTTDYEELTYDAGSNVTARRLRDGQSIGLTYDNLNRVTLKNLPGTEPDVSYGYDLLSRMISASQTGHALSFTYDALSRNLTETGPLGTVSSQWDLAGRRTRLTYPGTGLYVDYDYLITGETTKIRENGAASGVGVLATYAWDDLGRRTSLTFGNGVVQNYTFDPVSRLASLTNNLSGTTNDLSATFAYNPASQIASTTRTGDAYAWSGHFNQNVTGTPNGLNQLTSYGAKTLTHDARGNVTAFGSKSFTYSSENLLLTAPNSTTLSYDPLLRLTQETSGVATKFAYDGIDRIAEYNSANTLQRRYVHGPGVDEPLVWYEGTGTTNRRFLSSDERGSIVSVTDTSGALLGINSYDEYGQPASSNIGVWGYTGQAWLSGAQLWHYKARIYEPEIGRFLQTDPIGYHDGPNLYAYVGNDPVNFVDPLGLFQKQNMEPPQEIVVWGDPVPFVYGGAILPITVASPTFVTAFVAVVGNNTGSNDDDKNDDDDQCSDVLEEEGTIVARGISVTAILGLGISITRGTFRNVATGSTGKFMTVSVGAGGIAGVSETESTFPSISNFVGYGESVTYGFPVPFARLIPGIGPLLSKVGIGGSVHRNVQNQNVGKSSDVGVGRAGVAGTAGETSISQCTVGKE